ncbi:MAG TPA: hypothetical protein DCL35_02525 [Candidatus Omnitrophica bacterium]|nr:hypothetical protein [Candidatus Omnitrophota bacterium]
MKLNIKYIPLVLFFMAMGAVFAFFYTELALPEFNGFTMKVRDMRGQKAFDLPVQQTYLLKIWGDDIIEKAHLNGLPLTHTIYRPRKTLKEFYYLLPSGTTKPGENILAAVPGKRYSFMIRNNIVATDFGVISFKDNQIGKNRASFGLFASFMLLFSAIGLFIYYISSVLSSMPFNNILIAQTASFLPCIAFLYLIRQINNLLPINLYFLKNSYFGVCAFLIAIFYVPAMFLLLLKGNKAYTSVATDGKNANIHTCVVAGGKGYAEKLIGHRAVKWLLSREFADKCLILFMALLFSCAFLMAVKFEFLASFFGNIAYLVLVTAVIIKLRKSARPSQ